MATRKQKHAAAMAKRERWLAEVKSQGLRAQKEDHEQREAAKKKQEKQEKSKKKKKDPQPDIEWPNG